MDNTKRLTEHIFLQQQLKNATIESDEIEFDLIQLENMIFQKRKLQLLRSIYTGSINACRFDASGNVSLFRAIICKNGTKKVIYGKSEEIVVDKLLDYFHIGQGAPIQTFQMIFYEAIQHKLDTEVKSNTNNVNYLRSSFTRFVTPSLAVTPIKDIDATLMKKYTKQLVDRCMATGEPLKPKAFANYKCMLNLAFDYAVNELGIISTNPAKAVKQKDYIQGLDSCGVAENDKQIFTKEEMDELKETVRKRMTKKKYGTFYTNGYAFLLSALTGMRAGELPALKWSDVDFANNQIHIHGQQLKEITEKGKRSRYYFVPWTKDEKGQSKGGRYFPIYGELRDLLMEIRDKQKALGIKTKYVICEEDGSNMNKDSYGTFIRRLCQSFNLESTNNHTLRKTLNSLVLIPAGFTVTERAAMLGHTPETNLRHYSFDPRNSLSDKVNRLDSFLSA